MKLSITYSKSPDTLTASPAAGPAATQNEVAMVIDGERYRFWQSARITRSIDTVDIVEFSAPLNTQSGQFKRLFTPFSYKDIAVNVGGQPLFTGTMVAVDPQVSTTGKTVNVSAYSKPGVLQDCTAAAANYPLEFDGQTLEQIATALAGPFDISVKFNAAAGAAFERIALEPNKKILDFLADLAKQRNLIISSTETGELLFLQSQSSGRAVANLAQGQSPLISVAPSFSSQEYYSDITGIEPVIVGLAGSQFTVKNPRLTGVKRPFVFNATDMAGGELIEAVEAKAARMFANAVSYSVTVATWRSPGGDLWKPGEFVNLLAPDAMIYKNYLFLIRSVTFERGPTAETATLDLTIPGAFSGETPEALPWHE